MNIDSITKSGKYSLEFNDITEGMNLSKEDTLDFIYYLYLNMLISFLHSDIKIYYTSYNDYIFNETELYDSKLEFIKDKIIHINSLKNIYEDTYILLDLKLTEDGRFAFSGTTIISKLLISFSNSTKTKVIDYYMKDNEDGDIRIETDKIYDDFNKEFIFTKLQRSVNIDKLLDI